MAGGDHFGCPKITFDRISGHLHVSSLQNVVKSFKSDRADNEIVTRQTRRLRC